MAPSEYADFILMTELWHCPPTVFEEQPEELIDLHVQIYNAKNKQEKIEEKKKKFLEKLNNN